MSGLPSACQGQGGKLTHVRAFGKSLRDLHRRLHSGGDGPENLEGLRGVIQKLRSCDSCPRCKEDWSSRGLAGPLDDCWRALQETGSPATQPRRALLEAVEKFYEQTTVNLQVSNEDSSQLWFTQNSVKAVFTHGAHKGQRVSDLVEEIVESGEEQITKFKLIAVFHHGRYKCLCNRRLWAVREASKRLGFPLRVHVDVHPLLSGAKFVDGADGKATDVLLKFEDLHTTTSNGARVRVRPDPPRDSIEAPVDWLLKYQGGRDVDGTPLRTSVLPLLPRLPAIARYIVEGPQRVILMSGSTGCGKSTQVTQAVYDHVRQRDGRGRGPSVVCTQPRRLAACSLDEQVNTDRRFREVWPEEVAGLRITAHQIQGDSTKTGDTRLLFCTAGVLLQMLKRDGKQGVREFQYIFLDEVHERTIDDDLLMNFLCTQKFLEGTSVKVIVMSATLGLESLQDYFHSRFRECPHWVGDLCVDRVAQLECLEAQQLRTLAGFVGLELRDDSEEDKDELVRLLLEAQVVRPHPLRLAYLDDLLYHIILRENLASSLEHRNICVRPVGMVSAQLRHAVDEAWTVLRSRSSASPLDILVHLLDPKQDDKVISHYRESFSKLLCAQMALERVRNQSILLLSPEELSSVKEAVESQGPCRLHSKVVLAGGALPPGVVIQSWVRWDGQELHREPQAVTSTGGLPGAFDGPLVLEYSSSGSTAPDSDDDLRDRAYVALVFLPGLSMVSDFQYALQSHPGPPADEVFALHGKVRQEDQMAAVRPIESGCRVILSTNVAESSITVPNADAVVDLCLARTMRWNEDRLGQLGQLLDLDAATKDSLGQRAGRVGRTKAGLVLRMISREEFDGLSSGRLPEMLRRPVDKVMLKIVNMSPAGYEGGVDVESEIQACLSPPEGDKIKEALEQLLAAHAIEPVGDDGRRFRALRLGLLLEDLPMDLRLGLLVAWGVEAGLEHAAVDAAVMLQAHNVVGEPRSTLLDCGRAFIQHCATLRRFADGFPSDAVMLVNVLRAFRAESRSVGWVAGDACLRAADRMRHWCRDNGVNFASIQTVDDTVRAIHERVSVVVPSRQDSDAARIWEQLPCQELPAEESSILMVLFCGAFHRHALQVRNPTRATFLHGTYDQGWGDSEVVIHWDGVDLRRHELIQDRVAGFFSRGSCGIFGQCVNSGREGTAGGWARIALEPRSGNMTFGFPVEVSNVLKLQRDFAKLCDLGENVQVQIEHAASTKLVPIFWRWEDLTEKRQDVVVQVSSVAGPYLEPRPLSQQRCHAAVFCAKFDSFHTKTQKRWQKGETLTLLPHCGEAGEPREGPSLSELVLLIFGVRPRALAASEAPQGSGDGAGMALLGTPGLRPRLAAGRGALADDVYRSLCGPRCVLQEFGGSTHAEWRTQTGSVRRLLCSLLDRFGGPEALRALAWPRRAREAPEGLAAAARAAPGSDVSDGDLAESESEGGQDLPEGARSPVPASRGVCVVVDLDCWLAEHGCHSGPEEAAALFEAMLGHIQEQVGQEVVHVTARGSELAGACGQAGGLGPAAVADAVRRLVGPGKADVSVDSQHAGTRGPADAAKELGCELAFCALSYVRGAGPQASLSPHPAHLVLVLGPGLSSVLRHLTAQRTRPRFWATASPVHEERLRRLHPDVGLIRPFAPPAAASSNRDTQQTQMAEPEQESEPVLGRGEKFGRVKSFNASRDPAYGFVAGGQHGQDIYLPGKNCEAGYVPSPGDLVIFKEGKQKNGKPVANDVRKAQ